MKNNYYNRLDPLIYEAADRLKILREKQTLLHRIPSNTVKVLERRIAHWEARVSALIAARDIFAEEWTAFKNRLDQ